MPSSTSGARARSFHPHRRRRAEPGRAVAEPEVRLRVAASPRSRPSPAAPRADSGRLAARRPRQGTAAESRQEVSPTWSGSGRRSSSSSSADQELLGHASISTTQIYTRVEPGRLRAAYAGATGDQAPATWSRREKKKKKKKPAHFWLWLEHMLPAAPAQIISTAIGLIGSIERYDLYCEIKLRWMWLDVARRSSVHVNRRGPHGANNRDLQLADIANGHGHPTNHGNNPATTTRSLSQPQGLCWSSPAQGHRKATRSRHPHLACAVRGWLLPGERPITFRPATVRRSRSASSAEKKKKKKKKKKKNPPPPPPPPPPAAGLLSQLSYSRTVAAV